MPRRPKLALALDTATARLALPIRKKFYTTRLTGGVRLAYRRNAGAGTWTTLAQGWTKRFGFADDYEPANGATVLSFDQAVEAARKLARGDDTGEVEGAAPASVAEALLSYKRDLVARGGDPGNATRVLHHLPAAFAAKPV